MVKEKYFKIDVWLSRKAYKQNPSVMDYRTMGWEPTTQLKELLKRLNRLASYFFNGLRYQSNQLIRGVDVNAFILFSILILF